MVQLYMKAFSGLIVFTILLTVILVGFLFYAEFLQTHLPAIRHPDHIIWLELIVLLRVTYWLCNGPLNKSREGLVDFRYQRLKASTDLTQPISARRFSNKFAAEVIIFLGLVIPLSTAVYWLVESLRDTLSLPNGLGEIGLGMLILIVILPTLLLMDVLIGPSMAVLEENRVKEKEQKRRLKNSRDEATTDVDTAGVQDRAQNSDGQLDPDDHRTIDAQWYKLFLAVLDFISVLSAVTLVLYGARALIESFFSDGASLIYVGWFLWLVFALMAALAVKLTLWEPIRTLFDMRSRKIGMQDQKNNRA